MRILTASILILAACLAGCVPMERTSTIDQKQRENVGQKASSEFVQSAKPEPLSVTIPTKDGPIHITQPTASLTKARAGVSENSDSMAEGSAAWSESIPFFVKLIGVAIGAGLLVGLVWFIIHRSTAANAAWQWTNDAIAEKINTIRALKGASTDPARIQAYSEAESQLEHLRAEANK